MVNVYASPLDPMGMGCFFFFATHGGESGLDWLLRGQP